MSLIYVIFFKSFWETLSHAFLGNIARPLWYPYTTLHYTKVFFKILLFKLQWVLLYCYRNTKSQQYNIYVMVFFKIIFFKLAWSPSLVNARPMAFMSHIYMVIFFKLYFLYLVIDTPRANTLPYRLSGAEKSSITL